MNGEKSEAASDGREKGGFSKDVETVYQTLSGIVIAANGNAAKLVLQELRVILEDKNIEEHLNAVFPYLFTAGFLAFLGKEINKENMSRALSAVGIEPKEEIANMVMATKVRNNIIYLYSLYYLLVMGREITEENMFKLLAAIGEPVDDASAKDVLLLYNKKIVP